ncbi:MAG: flagellar hook assembly protein FlgD [Azonexus sp.]|nr:flagellar hook assembly protein FlgD [Azonexus sp.]MCK6411311.1 flagellar hook assembly protein FlgD [Azonexus sp.]
MATVNNSTSGISADLLASVNGSSTTQKSAVQEQETKFLTLLMTQMKNQDPLNPMDNAQVTSQLAQLNMASGIEKLNAAFGQLLTGYNDSMSMQSAAMIGKNVLVAGNNLPLEKSQAIAGVKLEADASAVTVTIKDAKGKVVQTESLGAQTAGIVTFGWDGKDADGKQLDDGKYTFSVEAKNGDETVKASAHQIGMVSAVVRDKTGFLLDLGAYGNVAFKDVQQIF